jgi:MoaA/NifB/PqqE/SkfB family radical SAM enzyme
MAYSLGLLITVSSNGSLLSSRIKEVFKNYPPYRLTLSMYGASASSYEELTQTPDSYQAFSEALEWLATQKIRVRLNIIQSKYNSHEIPLMEAKAKQYGFECNVFSLIIPTIDGNASPLSVSCPAEECNDRQDSGVTYMPCQAGLNSFHVNSSGQVSICKMARQLNCDFTVNHDLIFAELKRFSGQLLAVPTPCYDCEYRSQCFVCPPVFRLYADSQNLKVACKVEQKKKGGDSHGNSA